MRVIHHDTCIHHIYTQAKVTHVRKPQRRMNPTLKDIVKKEIQKMLNDGFIYPISDSKWISQLVVVSNKVTGKWRVYVEFREINKATLKDYFPLPFIENFCTNVQIGHKKMLTLFGLTSVKLPVKTKKLNYPWKQFLEDTIWPFHSMYLLMPLILQ
jgi:hypothetical protein